MIKTVDEFIDTYQQIVKLFELTDSYKTKELSFIDTLTLLKDTKIEDLADIAEKFKLELSELLEFYNSTKNEPCVFFKLRDNTNTLSDLLCSTCDASYYEHSSCEKYCQKDTERCDGCGLNEDRHKSCESFSYRYIDKRLVTKCDNCNLHYNFHVKKSFCGKFVDNSLGFCKECDRHLSQHFYTKKYSNMKEIAQRTVMLKSLELNMYVLVNPLYRGVADDINGRIYTDDYFKQLKSIKKTDGS